jgi:CheY-like chemotaxis protein
MRLRILLAEDHPDCAATTARLLGLWGHEVEIATDGPSALQAALARRPDVVLLDIALPGMDGWAVAKRLHERADGTRPLLVAISGYGSESDRRQSSASGIDVHLTKPVDPEELKRVLDSRPATLARRHSAASLGGPQPGTLLAGFGPCNQGPACHEADRTGSCQAHP